MSIGRFSLTTLIDLEHSYCRLDVPQKFHCELCEFATISWANFIEHSRKCDGKTTSRIAQPQGPMKILIHKEKQVMVKPSKLKKIIHLPSSTMWYKCAHCPFKYRSESQCEIHQRCAHAPQLPDRCEYSVKSKPITMHQQAHINAKNGQIVYTLKRGSTYGLSKTNIISGNVRRTISTTRKKLVECNLCCFEGKTEAHLNKHLLNEHQDNETSVQVKRENLTIDYSNFEHLNTAIKLEPAEETFIKKEPSNFL